MAKFKVGDRVRCIDSEGTICVAFGREYEVDEAYGRFVRLKNVFGGMYQHRFELIQAPTITIETGKHYRLRNGKVTGRITTGDIGFEALVDGQVKVFDKAGGAVFGGEDIVEAWVPRVGERVRLIKDGKSTKGAVGKAATLVTWDTGTFIDNNDYLLDIDPPVDYRTMSVKENFTRATIDCFEPLLVAAPAQPAPCKSSRGSSTRRAMGGRSGR